MACCSLVSWSSAARRKPTSSFCTGLGRACTAGVICGIVTNGTTFHTVTALRDWCSYGPCKLEQILVLHPGQSTPVLQDWDGFEVSCTAAGNINGVPWTWGKGAHQIHNGEHATIATLFC